MGFSGLIQAADGGPEERLYQTFLTPDVALGEEVRLDLGRYAGGTVFLTLAADPGPDGEDAGDWGMWVASVVEDARAA